MDGIRVLTVTGVQTCALPISLSTTRVYGQAVLEIDDTDDSHRRYSPTVILGWDIGGVNTKVACLGANGALTVRSRPFELQREPEIGRASCRERGWIVVGNGRHTSFDCDWSSDVCSSDLAVHDARVRPGRP